MKETITTCDRCGRPINQSELQTSSHIYVSKYQDAREYDRARLIWLLISWQQTQVKKVLFRTVNHEGTSENDTSW